MSQDGDGPTLVGLAHAQQPLEPFFDAGIIVITGLNEQRHDGAGIVGGVLIGKHAADIPVLGLAGKQELGSTTRLRMMTGEAKLLHQESEMPPGFDEGIIDSRMFFGSTPGPAPIGKLLLKNFLRLRQLPEVLRWADILSQ